MSEPLKPAAIRIVPLGGLGEIGMNCLAIEQQDGILVIDCGSSFPFDDLGIDVYHPNFSWLLERSERVSGVFLTHGHEDHIGGLPYLLDELDVPIWGPRHALGLVSRRLAEHGFSTEHLELNDAQVGVRYAVGPFEVEPIRVSHSIIEACALRVATRAGTLVHTGDFNLDPDPPDNEPTDEARLASLGDEGVALLLSDSTNIDVPVRQGSEREVGRTLEELVTSARGRVFISLFASNVHRLLSVGEIAARVGRKLCLLGRSLLNQREVAEQIGRLRWPAGLTISPEQAATWPRDELLVLAAGTQAEATSSMLRLANGTHQHLVIEPGDTVILSSRAIPGNERPVFMMMMEILRRGAVLHTRHSIPTLHTSGHAGQSEQRRMIELVRPRAFMPIHGTLQHLLRHAELARSSTVRDVLVVENGSSVLFDERGLKRDEHVPWGKVAIAQGGEPISPETLRRRAELGRTGMAAVSLALDRKGALVSGPSVTSRGIPGVDDEPVALRSVARAVARVLERGQRPSGIDLSEEIRRAARRELFELCGCRPVVEVHLLGPHD